MLTNIIPCEDRKDSAFPRASQLQGGGMERGKTAPI